MHLTSASDIVKEKIEFVFQVAIKGKNKSASPECRISGTRCSTNPCVGLPARWRWPSFLSLNGRISRYLTINWEAWVAHVLLHSLNLKFAVSYQRVVSGAYQQPMSPQTFTGYQGGTKRLYSSGIKMRLICRTLVNGQTGTGYTIYFARRAIEVYWKIRDLYINHRLQAGTENAAWNEIIKISLELILMELRMDIH